MSKIGNKEISVPSAVQVEINGSNVAVKGSGGLLEFQIPKVLKLTKLAEGLKVEALGDSKKTKSMHGLFRQLIYNAVQGVGTPWEKKLEIVGTGYNVKLQGEDLIFKIGFSHPVLFKKVPNIFFKVEGNNRVVVSGADKQLVGLVAFKIKSLKQPDSYKGKGIRYQGEIIKLKPGKKVKTTAGAA